VTAIYLTIPGDPHGKGRPRFGKGRTYTDAKTVTYENLIGWTGQQAMGTQDPLEGPLCVTIDARFRPAASSTRIAREGMLSGAIPPAKQPDCDNIAKLCLDALNGVVWVDDAQVVTLFIRKRYAEAAGLDITIRPYLPAVAPVVQVAA
jgi:Holliday junction resolvase RusA-like endonuclease